jgi:hypothetical protein
VSVTAPIVQARDQEPAQGDTPGKRWLLLSDTLDESYDPFELQQFERMNGIESLGIAFVQK